MESAFLAVEGELHRGDILFEAYGAYLLGADAKLVAFLVVCFKNVCEDEKSLFVSVVEAFCQSNGFFVKLGEDIGFSEKVGEILPVSGNVLEEGENEAEGEDRGKNEESGEEYHISPCKTLGDTVEACHDKLKVAVNDKEAYHTVNGEEEGLDSAVFAAFKLRHIYGEEQHHRRQHHACEDDLRGCEELYFFSHKIADGNGCRKGRQKDQNCTDKESCKVHKNRPFIY